MLLLLILLVIGAAVVLEMTLEDNRRVAKFTETHGSHSSSMPLEQGVFKNSAQSHDYALMGLDEEYGRIYDHYYDNRAYHGAPPTIPHEVKNDGIIGENKCLQCHQNGGYVAQFDAYAPVTPHPEMVSCRQCHVPANTDQLFKPSDWEYPGTATLQNKALSSSPPVIPHKIAMRENCLSCHTGPSAVKELRVSHPERSNCLQCHAKGEKKDLLKEWTRPTPDYAETLTEE